MGEKDSTMKDIKKGKGLPPLNPQNGTNGNGTTSENRGEQKGIRYEFASYDSEKQKGTKNK